MRKQKKSSWILENPKSWNRVGKPHKTSKIPTQKNTPHSQLIRISNVCHSGEHYPKIKKFAAKKKRLGYKLNQQVFFSMIILQRT